MESQEPSLEGILSRVDFVLEQNRRVEWIYIILTTILFGSGIAGLISAIVTEQYFWSIPPAFTTGLLYWPINQIRDLRMKNIALATVPILVTLLPREIAAEEIRRLIRALYGEN